MHMATTGGKRSARVKVTLTERTIEALTPLARPWIAWDDRVIGFGVKVHPSGVKSFIVNYRAGDRGRTAPHRRVVIARTDSMDPEDARHQARELLIRVARGEDPAQARTNRSGYPTLTEAFEEYLTANPDRKEQTARFYRALMRNCFADWLWRPLGDIARREVEARFHLVSRRRGRTVGNHAMSLLRSVYRRPCVDFEGLRNPVELWLAGGGRYHRVVRRRISAPSEVLPRWRRGIEAEVIVPATRDIFWCGLYTGLRVSEVFGLSWDRVSLSRRLLRVDETKTGKPLLLPVTRQLAAVLERRRADCLDGTARDGASVRPRGWVFPSATSASGHVEERFALGVAEAFVRNTVHRDDARPRRRIGLRHVRCGRFSTRYGEQCRKEQRPPHGFSYPTFFFQVLRMSSASQFDGSFVYSTTVDGASGPRGNAASCSSSLTRFSRHHTKSVTSSTLSPSARQDSKTLPT